MKKIELYKSFYKYLILVFLLFFSFLVYGQMDLQNGPVKLYYPNGQVSSEGMVKDGKPDGYWKTYYPTGIIKSEGKRSNFLLDSTWNFYNQAGELVEVINYNQGKKSGFLLKYTYTNPNNPGKQTLIAKELYINDKREGLSSYYYASGELKEEVNYSNGQKQGYAREYNKEGVINTLKQFKDNYLISSERINRKDTSGLKQGTYKTFYDDGSLKKEENYLDNELHGYFREFDEEGKLTQTFRYENGAIVEEIDEEAKEIIDFKRSYDEQGRLVFSGGYREGVPIGIHRFYDSTETVVNAYIYNEDGKKISEGIVDEQGRRKGRWKDFYVSGELRAQGAYRNNKRSGEWTFYFRNGKIEQQGSYLNGWFEGLWQWYYDTGELWREENYFTGMEDGLSVEYDREGNIIEKGAYLSGEKDGDWISVVGDHKEEGRYIIGLREGKWYHYYADGTLRFKGSYTQGQLDGKQVYFYPDGSIQEEQYYKNGVREKGWRKYDELGNITLSIFYKNNQEVRINGIRVKLPDQDIKVIN